MKKILQIFKKNFRDFQKFKTQIFKISIIHKPSLGSQDVPQKIWARSVQPFWRLLDTNKQTDRQAKFICRRKQFKAKKLRNSKTTFKQSYMLFSVVIPVGFKLSNGFVHTDQLRCVVIGLLEIIMISIIEQPSSYSTVLWVRLYLSTACSISPCNW